MVSYCSALSNDSVIGPTKFNTGWLTYLSSLTLLFTLHSTSLSAFQPQSFLSFSSNGHAFSVIGNKLLQLKYHFLREAFYYWLTQLTYYWLPQHSCTSPLKCLLKISCVFICVTICPTRQLSFMGVGNRSVLIHYNTHSTQKLA